MKLKIEYIESVMVKWGRKINRCDDYDLLLKKFRETLRERQKAPHTYFEEIESTVAEKYL